MSDSGVYEQPALWAGLKPTWRLLWVQIRAFHGHRANVRAERLVMRAMDRNWASSRLETVFHQLLARDTEERAERQRHQGVPA